MKNFSRILVFASVLLLSSTAFASGDMSLSDLENTKCSKAKKKARKAKKLYTANKKKAKNEQLQGHTDAVLGLSINPF